jgi:hypothetical protein
MKGKRTTLRTFRGKFNGTALRVRVVGREDLTLAERGRAEFIFLVLRSERSLRESLFIRIFWFPGLNDVKLLHKKQTKPASSSLRPGLNASQSRVVDTMVDESIPLVVVQGMHVTRCLL